VQQALCIRPQVIFHREPPQVGMAKFSRSLC
jgi:hypothetical protein